MFRKFIFCSLFLLPINAIKLNAQISTAGLIAQWSFNSNLADSSGNGHHATPHNISYVTDKYGITGGAANFNGFSSYAEVPYAPDLNMNKYTICATVKINAFYSGTCQVSSVFERGTQDATGEYGMIFNDTDGNCSTIDTNAITLTARNGANSPNVPFADWGFQPTLRTGRWYSFVATYDSIYLRIYIDGVLKNTNTTVGTIVPLGSSTEGAFIGAWYNSSGTPSTSFPYWFNGYMDDLRIYNRVLNTNEIVAYDTATKPHTSGVSYSSLRLLDFKISPNPSTGMFYLNGTIQEGNPVNIDILNSVGQVVQKEKLTSSNRNIQQAITLDGAVKNGVYFVEIKSGNEKKTLRVVLQR